jgi:signal transduction histidine kinase
VLIVGIQIVILRVQLSERTEKLRASSHALREQVEKLSDSNQALNSAKEANATLVRILCHDLATPVSTVELCLNRPNLGGREVDIIRRSVRKLKETISDVRDLQRLHAAKIEISRVQEDPRVLLLELKDLFAAELMAKDLELLIHTPDSPAFCLLDRSLVANQVFANVLRNAIKFSKRNSRIEVTVLPGDETVSVHFRDYGMGIPEELLVKLFDPMQRTSRPGTEKESGTGFGMPIIKACMEEMGGTVSVQSWTGTPRAEDDYGKRLQPQGTLVELTFEAAAELSSPNGQ